MKNLLTLSLLLALVACKDAPKKSNEARKVYPETLLKIFEHHGGIETWNEYKTLVFNIEEGTYTNDLTDRRSKIEMSNYTLGFDGKDVWLEEDSIGAFTGDKMFVYNLMFYFYAMPFVLGDEGIIYSETQPLIHQGETYPGIKISYGEGVGTSPEDNYFIYYNPKTYRMEWLGYTVTYFDQKVSNDIHYARYPEWENVEGLLLPKLMVWYQLQEDGSLIETDGSAEFTKAKISKEAEKTTFYEKKSG